jgi:hypothetical protein
MPHGGLRPLLPVFAAVCASLAPTAAAAQGLVVRLPGLGPTSLSATNTTIVRFRGTNFDRNIHDDEFFSLTERLDIAAQAPLPPRRRLLPVEPRHLLHGLGDRALQPALELAAGLLRQFGPEQLRQPQQPPA